VSTHKRLVPFASHAEDVNGRNRMEILYSRCCGLDVHAKTVVACLCIEGEKQIRTFSTMTADLWQLADWLLAAGCTPIAIESTGVYWPPVVNLLEDHFTVLLVNAHHIQAVPGRKTDVRDWDWIGDLWRRGLLKARFIPPRYIRELRELTRHRQILVRDRAAVANRMQKLLESANIKLGHVATNVLGLSGRFML
jgi:transposase